MRLLKEISIGVSIVRRSFLVARVCDLRHAKFIE
jgi:hypothetical protein